MDTRIKFIEKTCERKGRETRSDVSESATAFVSIPYVKAVSEGIQRILGQQNVKTAFRPWVKTLGDVFQKAKDRPPKHQVTGIVYKVKCESCSFVHIRESKSSGNSPGEGGGRAQAWHQRQQWLGD